MPRDFILPDLGEGIHEAQVVRVLIAEGQQVKEDQPLVEVETDKATVEIPSPFAGVAEKVHIKEGQTINVGAPLVTFSDGQGQAPALKAERTAPARPAPSVAPMGDRRPASPAAPAPSRVPQPEPAVRGRTSAPAAPAVRKLAREMGVDLDGIAGTGPGGRVTQQDVEAAASRGGALAPPSAPARPSATPARAPAPVAAPAGVTGADQWGPTRRAPLSQIRKTIATQMSRSAFTIPHVTHGDEADITDLDRLRRGYYREEDPTTRLTLMPFVIRALCLSLRQHPIFNASFDAEGGQIVYKEYFNVGIAVDTPRGLIVPVIRDADRMGIVELAAALSVIAGKVRTNQFTLDELRGGTFTITNYGALGGVFGTPIINFPEVAILGTGRAQERVVVRNGKMEVRLILPLSLSFDHRAADGAQAARFAREIIGLLESAARLLL